MAKARDSGFACQIGQEAAAPASAGRAFQTTQRAAASTLPGLMLWLLDTNMVSDLWKPRPNPGVEAWLGENQDDCALSEVTRCLDIKAGADSRRGLWSGF